MRRFFRGFSATVLLAGAAAAFFSGCSRHDSAGERRDPPPSAERVELPRDDGPHEPSLLEWWYWAGHLRADGGRRFGFHLVFFEARPLGVPFRVTHFAVADLQEGRFRFRVERERRPATGPRTGIELSHGDLSARAAAGKHLLAGRVEDLRLDLELAETRPPVLHHENGYIAYAFGGHAYYYSRTRMEARGVLRVSGQDLPVSGSAWFDHQWGDMGRVFDQGWDWFGLQLDDGRDIMVFRMRVAGEERLRGGTQVPADGPAVRLSTDEIAIEPEGTWKSPHTGCVYPRRWRIRARGEEFVLAPLLEDQEIPTSVPVYWEGLAAVSGAATGAAFIELNGYCR
jgi:predicted secreted hydrolase